MPSFSPHLLACLIGIAVLTGPGAAAADAKSSDEVRGNRVEWARLQSASPYWDRHADADTRLIELIRKHTSLNIGDHWHHASPESVAELSRYPFLYADTIAFLSPTQARNLAEYLRRGGFILIDACRNNTINPSIETFLRRQIAQLSDQFPDLEVGKFRPGHEIFSIYFKMRTFPPFRHQDGQESLYGVFAEGRLIAVISLNGFQCVWDGNGEKPSHDTECMQMVTNIYLYAMTR